MNYNKIANYNIDHPSRKISANELARKVANARERGLYVGLVAQIRAEVEAEKAHVAEIWNTLMHTAPASE